MKYFYTAKKTDGTEHSGTIEAADRTGFFGEFKKLNEQLVTIKEESQSKFKKLNFNISFSRIKIIDKIVFARNLAGMLEAGLSLSRAITVSERQTKNPKLKAIFVDLNANISAGKTFHESMALHTDIFPPIFISMARAGEESGNLAESLRQVSNQMEKSYQIKKKVKGAMIYPGIILSIMVLIGVLMMIFVVPRLTKTFKDMKTELPGSTKLVIWLSDFLSNHYITGIAIVVGAIFGLIYASKTKKGKRVIDFCVLKIPVVNTIVKESNSAQTARTLSSLLTAGVDLLVAVKITGEVLQNSYFKEVLEKTEGIVERGQPLSTVFEKEEKLFPIFVSEMMNVGEETGKLATMLVGVANFYENEVEQKTKDMSTIVEPFLMVIIGLSVGFFAVSMITPMYSVMNNI